MTNLSELRDELDSSVLKNGETVTERDYIDRRLMRLERVLLALLSALEKESAE